MNARELLDAIGIKTEGSGDDDKYFVPLRNSNEYARAYSALDKSKYVDLDPTGVSMTPNTSSMLYLSDDYDVYLTADFDTEEYAIRVVKSKE